MADDGGLEDVADVDVELVEARGGGREGDVHRHREPPHHPVRHDDLDGGGIQKEAPLFIVFGFPALSVTLERHGMRRGSGRMPRGPGAAPAPPAPPPAPPVRLLPSRAPRGRCL